MFKKIQLLLMTITLILGGCFLQKKPVINTESKKSSDKNIEKTLTIEDYQKLFDDAFLETQKHEETKKKGKIIFNIGLLVTDNENDVIPKELENLKSSIDVNYNFEDKANASAYLLFKMFFNESANADFEFFTNLENKKVSYILKSFNENTALFLGIEELLGGEDGIKAIQDAYLNKENSFELTDQQYEDMIASFEDANKEGEIVINTEDQEQKIAQSFVKNKVIEVTEGKTEGENYVLNFVITGTAVVKFLDEVAKINNIERDFSGELAYFEKMDISGKITIKDNKILNIDGEIFADKSLVKNADKDLIIGVNYLNSPSNFDTWTLSLIDSEKNTEQAKLSIEYKVE